MLVKTLTYTITIDKPVEDVFDKMTDNSAFPEWAKAWGEGMVSSGEWKEGNHLTFTDGAGSGTKAVIEEVKPNELVRMKHVAMIEGNHKKEAVLDKNMKKWIGSQEDYYFIANDNETTTVKVVLVVDEVFEEMMSPWNQALEYLKSLCERN